MKCNLLLFACGICTVSAFSPSPWKIPPSTARLDRRDIGAQISRNAHRLSESKQGEIEEPSLFSKLVTNLRTAASDGFGTRAKNVAPTMVVGDIVVPLCSDLDRRQNLAQIGLYVGVEYVICDIEEGTGTNDEEINERIATLKPAYPLRPHLERSDWPITLPVSEVPLWLNRATYEAGTAVGTLMLAGTYLSIAATLATVFRIAVVPSESMEPALVPGDAVLVTRSIFTKPKANDVVFFNPPSELDDAIKNSKIGRAAATEKVTITSTKGKQFLKRVVAVPGDRVGVKNSNPYVAMCQDGNDAECTYRVDRTGAYTRPDVFSDDSWNRVTPTINLGNGQDYNSNAQTLEKGQYFVAGDNGYRSVDSRVWGPLKEKYLFGTAQWVISPINHFGPIQSGPFVVEKGLSGEVSSTANDVY